ncbi:sugar transferase [Blastococcus sp. TF02-8]|uniref:sugar transferase n=1 Tax=Blastococcus sp. TF02-8 TaxID=2250574 RepID=UPI000DE93F80|nr:sugar transferase [Blastococcus sp. TF02-8]RBY96247.1 sugar transferase [Blastococcus sp. TF02-8]
MRQDLDVERLPLGGSLAPPFSSEARPRTLAAVSSIDVTSARPGWRRLTRVGLRPFVLALDLGALALGLAATVAVSWQLDQPVPVRSTLVFAGTLLLLLALGGLYRSRLSLSVLDDFPALTGRALVAAALAVVVHISWSSASGLPAPVEWRFLWGALATWGALVVLRGAGYTVVRRLRARGLVAYRTLIIGAGQVGVQVADVLQSHPEYGLRPIGFLDDDPPDHGAAQRLPVLGGPIELPRMLQRGGVRTVVVAFSSMKSSEMVSLIRTCDRFSCELFVVPRLFELHQVEASMDNAWGFPLVRLRRATYRSRAWRVKRVVDVAVSGLALVAILPALLLIALAVRLDGGPGILFGQERVGVDGHRFSVLKFRSLRPATEVESATTWNIGDDPRVTRVGRFLRATSLDELPQLINILRGDMSLVGPRPERPHFVDQFRSLYPSYEARHRVPSGLTGWAQIHGLRGDTSIADRARFDNYYIENWSLWLDVKIILRTFSSVLRGAGR